MIFRPKSAKQLGACAVAKKAKPEAKPLPAEMVEEMRRLGEEMSVVCYNLAISGGARPTRTITDQDRVNADKLRQQWDELMRRMSESR